MKILTTVIGSYPTDGLDPEAALRRAVADQIEAGVDLISDGQVRGDMVSCFVSHIPGYEVRDGRFTIIQKLEDFPEPVTLADVLLAREQAGGRAEVKAVLTGPTTLALASMVQPGAHYLGSDDPDLIHALANIVAREAAALAEAGVRVVQVDEPAFSTGRADIDLGIRCINRIAAEAPLTVLHVCGDVRPIFDRLLRAEVAVLAIEGTREGRLPPLDRRTLEAAGKVLCLGCVDSASERVEDAAEVRQRVGRFVERVGAENLWVAPDCGLRLLSRAAARGKLQAMVQAARTVLG